MSPELVELARQVLRLEGDAQVAALTLAVKVLEADAHARKAGRGKRKVVVRVKAQTADRHHLVDVPPHLQGAP